MSARDDLRNVFLALGSAHAGEALTPKTLHDRLRDPEFRARFNGPVPPKVTFPDERTAALAAAFENASTGRTGGR